MRTNRTDQVEFCDVLIIGGGAAGMACALTLAGQKRTVLLAEREKHLGGVLTQCIHSGFGKGYFGKEMTGTEYARAFTAPLLKLAGTEGSCVKIMTETAVLRINPDRTALLSSGNGLVTVGFQKVILATGCRERTLYSQMISGSRPAGIMTCGMAQKLINVSGLHLDDPVVILGTGDIGQIMARQLIQSGRKVLCMIEQNPEPGGRRQNREQCIRAFHIPVLLNSVIVRIYGENRIEAVLVRNVKTGQEQKIECAMLLTAIGLIPETELAEDLRYRIRRDKDAEEEPDLPDWLVRTGNCSFVHDIVDSVTIEAERMSSSLFPAEGYDPSCAVPARGNG